MYGVHPSRVAVYALGVVDWRREQRGLGVPLLNKVLDCPYRQTPVRGSGEGAEADGHVRRREPGRQNGAVVVVGDDVVPEGIIT